MFKASDGKSLFHSQHVSVHLTEWSVLFMREGRTERELDKHIRLPQCCGLCIDLLRFRGS